MIISSELAELCGIICGDGHLSRYKSEKRTDYRVEIVGHKTEDKEYFHYICSLFETVFHQKLTWKEEIEYARLYKHSKEILFSLEQLGLIVGKKSNTVFIPKIFLNDSKLSLAFLRGLADTDFCVTFKKGRGKLNTYPVIVGEFASFQIIEDISFILDSLNFTYCRQEYIKKNNFGSFQSYRVEIPGERNLLLWLKQIGFSNPKHISKIEVWKKLGYCPPKTTYEERIKIRDGLKAIP